MVLTANVNLKDNRCLDFYNKETGVYLGTYADWKIGELLEEIAELYRIPEEEIEIEYV